MRSHRVDTVDPAVSPLGSERVTETHDELTVVHAEVSDIRSSVGPVQHLSWRTDVATSTQ